MTQFMAERATSRPLIGQSVGFQVMLARVSALAPINRPVLVLGERGTGKELVAERLHYLSGRWQRPLIKLNCAALSESLLDAELFGHEAGAFTGAARRRAGRFEAADGGSLFLDEIATASAAVQEKLLRVVEYGEFERLGTSTPVRVDVRVIGATNVDLSRLAEEGRFRADLLDRLAFAVIAVPPLRQRAEDILPLAESFAMAMTRELGRPLFAGFAPEAVDALQAHPWPGNVRELRNVVERAVALNPEATAPIAMVELDAFAALDSAAVAAPSAEPVAAGTGYDAAMAAYERRLLEAALTASRFSQAEAARRLGLTYHRFRHLLRRHGLVGRRE